MKPVPSLRGTIAALWLASISACATPLRGTPAEYAFANAGGSLVAEARVLPSWIGDEIWFTAHVQNHSERQVRVEASLRLAGEPAIVFGPGRFSPQLPNSKLTDEVPAGTLARYYLAFDLPAGRDLDDLHAGDLELELRATAAGEEPLIEKQLVSLSPVPGSAGWSYVGSSPAGYHSGSSGGAPRSAAPVAARAPRMR